MLQGVVVLKWRCFVLLLLFTSPLYSFQIQNDSTYAFADLLIWKIEEGASDNWAQEITPAGVRQTTKILGVPFEWTPGVRLGVGYEHLKAWDLVLYYTGYQTTGQSQANVVSGGVFSAFLGNFYINNLNGAGVQGPDYFDASINWKFRFNTVDLELGRTFDIDQRLTLHPFLGLKAASIDQSIRSKWDNPTTPTTFTSAVENLKNDFWGFGPSLGVASTWPLYQNQKWSLSLIGDLSGALLWGHWRFKDVYENNTPTTVTIHLNRINGAETMGRGVAGVEWSGYTPESNLSVRLSYEAQVWFNQMQYYSFNMGRLNHLMSLQGGVLEVALKF